VPKGRHRADRPNYVARRAVVVGVAACLLGGLVVGFVLATRAPSSGGSTPHGPSGPTAATHLGPDGEVASWVVAQNQLPGTTAWQIPASVPIGAIEGFANRNYASDGQRVGFYVNTRAPTYHVDAYRMGYYQGKGAHLVWSSGVLHGRVQPSCTLTPGINLVSCADWRRSFNVVLSRAFVQGDYLFKLAAGGRAEAYVPLTVWDTSSHATYLIMNRTFVEQGWNTFGGFSYYQGEGACAPGVPVYPVCNRARVVSFDRPYDTGAGASDFMGDEYPLIRFCEQHGLDVAYATDVTMTEHPELMANHRVLLSLGHDESWSYQERVGLVRAMDHGLNVIFFGAASVLRHVRLQASPLGPDREEVDYRDPTEDPWRGSPMEVTGNTWSSPPTNWSGEPMVGEVYSGYLNPGLTAPMVVTDPSSWVFKGTGLHGGSVLPHVIASDIDHFVPFQGLPANLAVLAHSPVPLSEVYTNQGTWGNDTFSDMTYYTNARTGSGVVDTGNNNWINAMDLCAPRVGCPGPALQKITGNLLWLFGQGPAARLRPSRSNLASVQPAGS
jgi:hypothetical protein